MDMFNKIEWETYDENLNSAIKIDLITEFLSRFIDNLSLKILRNCYTQGKFNRNVQRGLKLLWIYLNGLCKWPPKSPYLRTQNFSFGAFKK